MGISPDVANEAARSHVMAFPSRYEGFPNALAEAMAVGLPAVAFANVSGVEELVISGETGILVCHNQERYKEEKQSFAGALQRLMTSADLRTQLGTAAKITVRQFGPEIVFSEWDKLIAAALQDNGL